MSSAEIIASGFAFPEGPAFDPAGNLFLVNCNSGVISRVAPEGQVSEFVNTGGVPVGLAFDRRGELFVADTGTRSILRVSPTGDIATFADRCDGEPLNGPNDLCFSPRGVVYFTDPAGSSVESPMGGVFGVSPEGAVTRFAGGLAFPNGIAFSADGSSLFVAETGHRRILRFRLREDGSAAEMAVFAQMEGGVGPDGMAFDAGGNLYVAHFGAGAIAVFGASGVLVRELSVGGANPTNLCFGGPGFDTLFITEAETGTLRRLPAGARGLRLFA